MSQKLYTSEGESSAPLVTLTAKLMNVEEDIEAVKVAADNKALQRKSLTGRWPVLEAPDGTLISESLPIAKYLARQHPTFYGQTEAQSKYHIHVSFSHLVAFRSPS